MLEHFHEGNLTYRVAGIAEKVPTAYVEVSPRLAAQRSLKDGGLVRIISPYGRVKLRAVITDRVRDNELYLPMNTPKAEEAVNYLTSSYHDQFTHTPAYKDLHVRLEVLETGGPSPMTKGNYRLGHPNPQSGVQVERAWARSDYAPLTGKEDGHGTSDNEDRPVTGTSR